MRLTTFEATADGGSRFRELDVPLDEPRDDGQGHTILMSEAWASPAVRFIELPAALAQDWHHAPARQVVVVLSGTIEVETSDGATRRWSAGEAFVPADLSGRGHRTRCIGGPVRLLFAPLAEGALGDA